MIDDRSERLPLPSEDSGDLADEPRGGMTDDPIVATEEGVPYDPPTERVLDGTDVAGARDDAGELEREGDGATDDALRSRVVEALRASDVTAGDRIRIAADGGRVRVTGEVESVDALDEILGIVGDVEGVEDVVDEVTVTRA